MLRRSSGKRSWDPLCWYFLNMYLVFGIVYVMFEIMYLSNTSPSLDCSCDERWWDPYFCYFWHVIYIGVYLAFGICGMYLSNAIPRSAVPASVCEILTAFIFGHVIYIAVYLAFGICGMYLSNAIPRSAVPASVCEILTVGHLQSAKWSRQSTVAHSSLWSNTFFAQVLLAQLDWPSIDWLSAVCDLRKI